jgi:nicotinamidase-related amidase
VQLQPDDVADIAVEVRSVENLNVPARQGCTPKRCQIRGLIANGGLIGVAARMLPAHHDVFTGQDTRTEPDEANVPRAASTSRYPADMRGVTTDPHLVPHRQTAALVTIDMQRDFLSESSHGVPGTTEVVPALRRLTDAFRAPTHPIVHVVRLYQPGGDDADRVRRTLLAGGTRIEAPGTLVATNARAPPERCAGSGPPRLLAGQWQELGSREYALFKPRWSAFYRTALQELLDQSGVDSLVLAAATSPTARGPVSSRPVGDVPAGGGSPGHRSRR